MRGEKRTRTQSIWNPQSQTTESHFSPYSIWNFSSEASLPSRGRNLAEEERKRIFHSCLALKLKRYSCMEESTFLFTSEGNRWKRCIWNMEDSTHLPLSCRSTAVRGFLATAGDTGVCSWSSPPAPLCLKSSLNFSSSNCKTEDGI